MMMILFLSSIAECPTDFSCGYASSGCYSENERCNGKGICPNNFDEMACNELHCSSDKGLFLCSNRRCVYETLRCNRMNDCLDNSDEDDCSTSPSTRVIFAAVVCTLICALVLVSAMGCVCKVYRRHVHHLNGGHRHETPLSRQLSEMLHRRAPPPPYHEAMLTSRPYSEAHLELPNQAEQQQPELLGAINNGYLEDTEPELLRQQLLSRQSNERSGPNQPQHSLSNILHHYSTRLGLESDRLGDVDSLLLFSEVIGDAVQHDETTGRERTSNRDLPAHSETGASTVSYPCSSGDTWQEDVEDILRDDNFHAPCDEESLIQMEFLPSTDVHLHVADQPSTVSKSRNSTDMRLLPPIHHCGSSDEVAKDTISTGTDNPVDSSRIVEEHDDKIQEDDINLIDEDSDSDCILAENCVDHDEDDVDDGDSTDSDSVCILDQV
uniref:Uncharacterized protein n=1 Tax=Arion vulgaris TaxID=1028688 RepID=A0A0B7AG31_9EUPU